MSTERIPSHASEALKYPKWKTTMMEEMHAQSWDIVDLPQEKSTVGCNWV